MSISREERATALRAAPDSRLQGRMKVGLAKKQGHRIDMYNVVDGGPYGLVGDGKNASRFGRWISA